MSHVLVSTCRFLSRQRLCCQLGYFFFFNFFPLLLLFFSPFFFSFLPLFLSGSQPVVGRQPLLETISWADLC